MSFHDNSSQEFYDSIFEKNCEQFLSLDAGALLAHVWQKEDESCDCSE
jgi:hypothetical protein